jgi:cation diffusion facilitator CzcD-associated flavoprotein CzcO
VSNVNVAIVGTGFSGLGLAAKLKEAGEHDFAVFERATEEEGVGGTWRANTYPGCRCDVPSNLYSFSFAPNPEWTTSYAAQPEIRTYLQRVARDLDLLPHIRFGCPLQDARWDGDIQRWRLSTPAGEVLARFLALGNGALAEPAIPDLPGLSTFEGEVFHSAHWRHDHDLRGRTVAVVGTGASAIQFVPQIQPQVGHLDLYQRTPSWVMPHTNHPVPAWRRALYRRFPAVQRAVRGLVYVRNELSVIGFKYRPQIMEKASARSTAHLHRAVQDPDLRRKLTPDYTLGCKRVLLSNDFYPAVAQPNVSLHAAGVAEVRPDGVVDAEGTFRPCDTIIFGTGFHVTQNPGLRHVFGVDGRSVGEVYDERGMAAYNGTTVTGFPNLFMLAGPNTGIGHTSLVYMIEAQMPYILEAMRLVERSGAGAVDVRRDALDRWTTEVQQADTTGTVWTSGCRSWYLDHRGVNTVLWPDFTFRFKRRLRRFDAEAYDLVPAAAVEQKVAV